MTNGLNNNFANGQELPYMINQSGFSELSPELQDKCIDSVSQEILQTKSAGKFGIFFGTEPSIASMNIGLTICGLLFVILVIDLVHSLSTGSGLNIDLIKTILPTFTLFLGYLFGKSPKE